MPLDEPSERRKVAVRLSDVPREVRLKAAARLAARDPDPQGLLSAALLPSRTTYYVSELPSWMRSR